MKSEEILFLQQPGEDFLFEDWNNGLAWSAGPNSCSSYLKKMK